MEDRRQGPSIDDAYRARLASRRVDAERLERQHANLAWARLGLFGLAVALIVALGRSSAPWLALPVGAFVPLLFVHARVLNRRDRTLRAIAFYERGIARLTDAWQGSGERGERYRTADHLYAEDLDLFGAGGLFELLVTTRTRAGEDLLASWLRAPAPPETIRARQQAVVELAPKLDFHEDLSVMGPDVDSVRTDDLLAWAEAPPQLKGTWPRVVLPLVAAVSTTLVVRWIWTSEPPDLLVPALVIQGLLALRFRHGAHHVSHGIEQRDQELRVLATIMERIEREPAETPLLRALRERVRATGRSPADEIRRLARLIDILSSGHNQIFAPISALLLLGTQLAFAAEHWRARCGPAVAQWLSAVAEYEALSALATYTSEHPQHPFPEIVEGAAQFDGESLAHPLLPHGAAVPNDVRLGGSAPHLLVVSGSNMSGKSTLLRTVGLNAVLAQSGAPVRATRLRLTPFRIGATLRIQDSLQAGRSRFFAEITRISEIVALTSVPPGDLRPSPSPAPPSLPATSVPLPLRHLRPSPSPGPPSLPATSVPLGDLRPSTSPAPPSPGVLFLLDELLAGTNSHDRLQGATGILTGLVERGAIGLATTHDLALTAMAEGLGDRAVNVHFEDRFEDGTLTFDYTLKPGVVQTSNAIALMRAVGLDV